MVGTVQATETGKTTGRWMVVTAYCSCTRCCGEHAVGYFASGERAYWGGVAADWGLLPAGTELEIEGYIGAFKVEDTGRVIKGSRLDIWMPTHRAARKFGCQRLWVTINKP
jgi:3D (Asp-Asp-Asp) domain-containing protein